MDDRQKATGHNGRILHVDLGRAAIRVEEPPSGFFRTYLGGGLLGTYYAMTQTRPGIDALSPDNVLVFAPSVVTGAAVMGVSRFNITAKSPLTGAIGDTQCGGDWGARFKHAGYDALVISGRSPTPVYLLIDHGNATIRDARHVWGKTTGEAQALLREELGDEHVEVAQIGPAGENLIRFACVTGGLSHFAGRTGMGAVMGSKNLKAVVVRGRRQYSYSDDQAMKALARKGVESFKASEGLAAFQKHGTGLLVAGNHDKGNFVTRNFREGNCDGWETITGETMTDTILKGRESCYACPIRCKRVVATEEPYAIDGQYGGPEFETLMMLGPNIGIANLAFIAKASEICNKYTMDSITAGGVLAFAMECFESGIIGTAQTDGLDLCFGNEEAALRALEMMAARQGFGDLLADGIERAAEAWGAGGSEYAVAVKNQPFAAHMPQIKPSMALIYAVHPSGPDHMACEHDWIGTSDNDLSRALGITDTTELNSLDRGKVKATLLSSYYYSVMDVLTVCHFVWGPGAVYGYDDLCELVRCTTGWSMGLWELIRAGERRLHLMKSFNLREGRGAESDVLPPRMFQPLRGGPGDGRRVDPGEFARARTDYYSMMGWDPETGVPLAGTLMDLGLDWIVEDRSDLPVLAGDLSSASDS